MNTPSALDPQRPASLRLPLKPLSNFTQGACTMFACLARFSTSTFAVAACLAAGQAQAFNSGSTGADGALAPTANIEVVLPPSGILNYTSINIPNGVVVRFKPNALNTPVVLLVSGNATINGSINVDGGNAPGSGTEGDGVLSDDGNPGVAGPGGYAGGRGGRPVGAGNLATSSQRAGGKGLGPEGGTGAVFYSGLFSYMGGAGGGYGSPGGTWSAVGNVPGYEAGSTYGSNELLPLVGGSGGGGGGTSVNWHAGGGGGGGGALLLAVSGTLTINGRNPAAITALGGAGARVGFPGCQTYTVTGGGSGSGGAIRLIATTLTGNGYVYAYPQGGGGGCGTGAGSGGNGRIRMEADTLNWNSSASPTPSVGTPGPVFIPGLPTLKISSIAGSQVPDPPTGEADVRLPANTANPVTVAFATTGIPVGNIVKLSVTPHRGTEVTSVSTALTGSTQNATATATVSLPVGASTLQASITYTVIVALGEALSRFAGNERVDRIQVTAGLDGKSTTRLITVSGREFIAPPEALRLAAFGG